MFLIHLELTPFTIGIREEEAIKQIRSKERRKKILIGQRVWGSGKWKLSAG
jgi:hypothetical protein